MQIAGTNGKGSTAAMTEAILRAAGLRTGLYTSPHLAALHRAHPRRRASRPTAIGWRRSTRAVAATGVPLTYFEVATVLGFLVFAEEGVEVAVLETGLGGRLDAVTACEPLATAITSIGLDHMDYLGDTLAAIAREKAGILKPGVPCFLGAPARRGRRRDRRASRASRRRAAAASRARLRRAAVPVALAGRAPARQRGARGRAGARGRRPPLGRPLDARGGGARRSPASAGPAGCERIGDDLLLDCAHNAEGARALAAALPALAAGPPRRAR